MFHVEGQAPYPDFRRLGDEADILVTQVHCGTSAADFRLTITGDRRPALFNVDRARGVSVSMYQCEGLCQYAKLDRNAYFRLCALLGKIQWRALVLNPLLVEEDLTHESPSRCLFAPQTYKQDCALVLENPFVCSGCVEFYRCLGAEREMAALHSLLDEIRA